MSAEPGLLLFPSRELPLVWVAVYRRIGASADPLGKEGLGRFMARLMRRTGGGHPTEVIDERIDALGASMGIDGSHSVLSFHGTVISRNFEPFGDLLADVLVRPSFAAEEHERLQRETRAEIIEARDNDRSLAQRWFRSALFEGHPYSRSVGGRIASIEAITGEDVRAHHRETITPGDLLFSVSGNVSEAEAQALVTRATEGLPASPAPPDGVPEPTVPDGRRLLFVDKPQRTQTQVLIGGLGSHPHDDDHTALLIANTIFGGTFTARLSNEVRSKRGWSYGAYSSLPYDRRRRSFSMWTFPKADDAPACIALELELLERLVNDGVTKKELGVTQRYLSRSHAFSVDTAQKRAGLAADEALLGLPAGYHAHYVERVRAVTLDQVNDAIGRRLSPENLLIVVVGTEADVGQKVRDAVPRLAASRTVAFDEDV